MAAKKTALTGKITKLLPTFVFNQPASPEAVADLRALPVVPTDDYLKFMATSDGGADGDFCLELFDAKTIREYVDTDIYTLASYGLIYFGTDGGGGAFCFYSHEGKTVILKAFLECPHEREGPMGWGYLGDSFIDFLKLLRKWLDEDPDEPEDKARPLPSLDPPPRPPNLGPFTIPAAGLASTEPGLLGFISDIGIGDCPQFVSPHQFVYVEPAGFGPPDRPLSAHLFNLTTGAIERTFTPENLKGKWLSVLVLSGGKLASQSDIPPSPPSDQWTYDYNVWDIATGRRLASYTPNVGDMFCKFNHSITRGDQIIYPEWERDLNSPRMQINTLDLLTGQVSTRFTDPPPRPSDLSSYHITFAPDGRGAAVEVACSLVYPIDLATGAKLCDFDYPEQKMRFRAFTPDSSGVLCTTSKRLLLFDMRTGKLRAQSKVNITAAEWCRRCVFSADGSRLLVLSDCQEESHVYQFHATTLEAWGDFPYPMMGVGPGLAALSPDGRLALTFAKIKGVEGFLGWRLPD